jgi:hypothetical protein
MINSELFGAYYGKQTFPKAFCAEEKTENTTHSIQ